MEELEMGFQPSQSYVTYRNANAGRPLNFLKMVRHDVPNEFGIADKSGKIVSVECFP